MGRLPDAKRNLTAGISRIMKKNISIRKDRIMKINLTAGKDRTMKINLTAGKNRITKGNLSAGKSPAMVKESTGIFRERAEDGLTAAGADNIRRVISFRKILIKTEAMITSPKAAGARAGSGLW
jgi:hypothetical protein